MMSERLLTADEAAELLAVPVSWIRAHTLTNEIPHVPLGRYKRYREADLRAWIETLAQPGKPGVRGYAPRSNSPRAAGTAEGVTTTKE